MPSPLMDREGKILVDLKRFPHLFYALLRASQARRRERAEWRRVAELRAEGRAETADRLMRKLLGVQGPAMTEEKRAALRKWREAHKDEILERAKQKRRTRRRTMELLKAGRRR